jgi:hypothetical protein
VHFPNFTVDRATTIEWLMHQGKPVLYFYCNRSFNDPDRQDFAKIMQALLHQTALQSPGSQLPKILVDEYERRRISGMAAGSLEPRECCNMILSLLNSHTGVTIVLDALDECFSNEQSSLIDSLERLVAETSSAARVKVLASSRDDGNIAARLQEYPSVSINSRKTKNDIDRYVYRELNRCIEKKLLLCGRVSEELRDEVAFGLISKTDGMY